MHSSSLSLTSPPNRHFLMHQREKGNCRTRHTEWNRLEKKWDYTTKSKNPLLEVRDSDWKFRLKKENLFAKRMSLKDVSTYFLFTAKYLLLITSLLGLNTKAQMHKSHRGASTAISSSVAITQTKPLSREWLRLGVGYKQQFLSKLNCRRR